MRNTVLTFGLIAGAILSAVMLATLPFQDTIGFDYGYVVGYSSMVLAFLMIFFGVRSYRDTVGGGAVSFGRGLAVGTLIAVVASLCYVATWEVIYYKLSPNFIAKYQAYELGKERERGLSAEAIAKKKVELDKLAEMYKNPAINAAMTFAEPMPVGLVIALVSAGVLARGVRSQRAKSP